MGSLADTQQNTTPLCNTQSHGQTMLLNWLLHHCVSHCPTAFLVY